jgi:hypothetical protein
VEGLLAGTVHQPKKALYIRRLQLPKMKKHGTEQEGDEMESELQLLQDAEQLQPNSLPKLPEADLRILLDKVLPFAPAPARLPFAFCKALVTRLLANIAGCIWQESSCSLEA